MDGWEKANFAEMCIPGLKSVGKKKVLVTICSK